jgi:hypothetical protein
MGHWALVKRMVSVLPRGGWRDALIRHAEGCPACRTRLAGRDEARGVLVQADQIGRLEKIWPFVEKGISRESRPAKRPRRGPRLWLWAAAAGGIGVAAAMGFLILGNGSSGGVERRFAAVPAADSLRILSASVAGRPADLYVVDIPEDRMTLVWMGQQPEKGERS